MSKLVPLVPDAGIDPETDLPALGAPPGTPLASSVENNASVLVITSSQDVTVPAGITAAWFDVIGGGGGGGGGGSAASEDGIDDQAGGAGGSAGAYVRRLLTGLQPGMILSVLIGAGGSGGLGGAANANAGTEGFPGGTTTVAASQAPGGGEGAGSAGNSSDQVLPCSYGCGPFGWLQGASMTPGSGAPSGEPPGGPIGMSGWPGGGGQAATAIAGGASDSWRRQRRVARLDDTGRGDWPERRERPDPAPPRVRRLRRRRRRAGRVRRRGRVRPPGARDHHLGGLRTNRTRRRPMNYAVIENGTITNVIACNDPVWAAGRGFVAIPPGSGAWIGWGATETGGEWTFTPPAARGTNESTSS